MKIRRCLISLFAVICLTLAVYFEPTRCVRGWLRGEAFFEGRPTSWWREVILHNLGTSHPTWWDCICRKIHNNTPDVYSLALVRDPKADGVLSELTNDSDKSIVRFSKHFLRRHQAGVEIESDFDGRVEWQYFLALDNLNAHKRFE
jgi:hypothetical protein